MTLTRRQSRYMLLAAALCSLGWSYANHRFQPIYEPDSHAYLEFDWSSTEAVLGTNRTIGYPLFVAAVRTVSDDPRAIPFSHWLALVFAAFVFQEGLIALGVRSYTVLWCAGTLLLGRGIIKFGPLVLSDSLAISLAIAATGCFFASLSAPRRWGAWCGLILLTFSGYQTRPAYLFLIPLWPVFCLTADRLILRRGAPWLVSIRRGAAYAAATVIPFVLFCSLRWALVGHWGLVSFGGYNLFGVVGQFLDEDSAATLPADLQPLAREMLKKRAQWANYEPPVNFLAMEQMYNPTVWEMAVPTIRERHEDKNVRVNHELSQLSRELLKRHFRQYCQWLLWNSVHAFKVIFLLVLTDHGTGLLCLVFGGLQAWSLWRGPHLCLPKPAIRTDTSNTDITAVRFLEWHLLLWTAIAFVSAKGLLVILVEPANERYMTGAMPLLPAALAVLLVHYLESRTGREI